MFSKLTEINTRPAVFSRYTADALWADEYRSKQMLALHLNRDIDVSSRNMGFIDRSASWLTEQCELGPGKSVCDFGCGPGLYTSRFATSGASVTGLDFSENSIRHAITQAEKSRHAIRYIKANYLDFEPQERFDLITMIMCDFCALSPVQRKALLGRFRRCLKPDGTIVLDVYSMAAYADRDEVALYEKNQLNQFWFAEDYFAFVNTFKYDNEAVILDKYSLFPETGEAETVYNWLQYFTPDRLSAELSEAGFTVKQVYKDISGTAYDAQHSEFAIVAMQTS